MANGERFVYQCASCGEVVYLPAFKRLRVAVRTRARVSCVRTVFADDIVVHECETSARRTNHEARTALDVHF